MKVIKTKYDGFIVTEEKGKVKAYEGYALCPKKIQKEIDNGNYKEVDCFWTEAVEYGYI